MSAGADTKANTLGAVALQVGDVCLVEDGSKRNGALGSDVAPTKTASEGGRMRHGESRRVTKANTGRDGKKAARGCGGGKAGWASVLRAWSLRHT